MPGVLFPAVRKEGRPEMKYCFAHRFPFAVFWAGVSVLYTFFPLHLFCRSTAVVCETALRPLPEVFTQWLESDALRHASVGLEVAVLNPDATAHIMYSYRPHRMLVPASTMKLVTTAAALRICGGEAVVETEVGIAGSVNLSAGCLEGDIVLCGHGDATLASVYDDRSPTAFADSIVAVLKRMGVKNITGRVIGDGSRLADPAVAPGWTWEDLGNYYAAGLYGLNYAANTYSVILDTSGSGRRPEILRIEPFVEGLTVENRLSSEACAFDSAYLYGMPRCGRRILEGAVPHGGRTFSVKGDIPDPPLFAAQEVTAALRKAGITVQGSPASDGTLQRADSGVPVVTRKIYVYRSAPLRTIARHTNVSSQNLLAEMLLRQIALKRGAASQHAALQAVTAFWHDRGLDVSGLQMYDGCGLSPYDRLTARFLTGLLAVARSDENFWTSLSVAGRTGTVRNFLAGTRLAGKARLKTGTTKQVLAYSGYVEGSDGRTYLFTLIVNNYKGKTAPLRRQTEALMLQLIP